MPVPIISVSQMREWENATWAAKRTVLEVISRVGHIVASYAKQITRPGDTVLILAGKGHNGDDARQAVQNLADREVTLVNVHEPEAGLREFNSLLSLPPALIIEGLIGIGIDRPLEGAWRRLIDRINRTRLPVLSIDTPAGLNADTGLPMGTAIQAAVTLTLGAPKLGLLAPSAADYVGRLEVAPDIGLLPPHHETDVQWTLPGDFDGYPPRRMAQTHKGTYGHLYIIAGSLGWHGAAVLAARGALRAQPGLVTLAVPESVYVPVASQLQAVMVRPWLPGRGVPEGCTGILAGPGLANPDLPAGLKEEVVRLWRTLPLPMVADASALDWLPSRRSSSGLRVVTPHPGEAARILGTTVAEVQADRPGAVRRLSRRLGGCLVALKGHQTAVGGARGPIYINGSGNPLLAQGGSGDLLAGYLAGLFCQPGLQADPLTAVRYAVWQHGLAADALATQRCNWTVEDLASRLGLPARPGFLLPLPQAIG